MRKYHNIAAAMIAALLTLTGCQEQNHPDEAFMNSTQIGLTVDGLDKVIYNPVTFQLGYSETLREFRVHTDKMDEYFYLTCSEIPSKVGQSIKCELKCQASNYSLAQSNLSFKVEQIGSDGTVWLWCSKKKIGIRVRILN